MSYKYKCRCKKCGSRKTLTKHPAEYMKTLVCWSCKSVNNYRIDWYRTRGKESKKFTCKCDGMPYPHRKGSTPFCVHSDDEPTYEDMMKLTDSVRRL